jgi:DNA-binding MarR family transcriptional regulator
LAYIIKKKDQIDRRITRLIGTPTAIVRFESYLATLLLAMHNSDILKLDDEEKESFSALIFKEADSVPILKGLSPEKLKVLNKVWRNVP